jgi:hypothetical protein
MGAPTSSYATASIALRVSGALKPHHHDKVETPSVRVYGITEMKCKENGKQQNMKRSITYKPMGREAEKDY